MSDQLWYDLLDEVNCADTCEAVIALCGLIDKLLEDIRSLELECISTRHLLSRHMNEDEGELFRMDILSNLARRYDGDPSYDMYKAISIVAETLWNFAIILSRYKWPATGNIPVLAMIYSNNCNCVMSGQDLQIPAQAAQPQLISQDSPEL